MLAGLARRARSVCLSELFLRRIWLGSGHQRPSMSHETRELYRTRGRLMLNMLATLAEYERELIVERVNAGIAAARQNGTRFGRPVSDPIVIADKLAVAQDARRRDAPRKTPPASSAGAAQRSTATSKPSLPAIAQRCSCVMDGSEPRRILRGHVKVKSSLAWPGNPGSACVRCSVSTSSSRTAASGHFDPRPRVDAGRVARRPRQRCSSSVLALAKPRPSLAALHRLAVTDAWQRDAPVPGHSTVWDIVLALDPALGTLAHEGAGVIPGSPLARLPAAPNGRTRRVRAGYPNSTSSSPAPMGPRPALADLCDRCLGNRLAGRQISQEMDSSSALTLTQAMSQTSPPP